MSAIALSPQFDSQSLFGTLGKSVTVLAMSADGAPVASVATAVCNLADDPASILVCLKTQSSFGVQLLSCAEKSPQFSVNVLAADQQPLLDHLMTSDSDARFSQGDWQQTAGDVPWLADAASSMHCQLLQWHEVDTHSVCIARVLAAHQQPGTGTIIYHGSTFHTVTSNPQRS